MIFNMAGGGGTSLNFTVVGGTSQPSSPKENTIWVNTSTTITSWVFSAEQPSNPTSGMVWIQTGASSNAAFNALKKNNLQVYPLSAKQYVSYSWVDKTVKSYQGSKWCDWWNGELYDSGNQYTNVTGGWRAISNDGWYAQITINDDHIYCLNNSTKSSGLMGIGNNTPLDLSKFSVLRIIVDGVSGSNSHSFGIVNTYNFSSFATAFIAEKAFSESGTYDLDISSITSGLPLFKIGISGKFNVNLVLMM